MPADGSALTGDDFEGVFCDFCHASVDPLSAEGQTLAAPDVVPSYGMGMYVITNGTERRGPYNDATAPHSWQFSAFHRTSNICGVCHDVSNPTNCPPLEPYNTQACYPVERTFSEWNNSIYATMGEAGNCQSCHMPHVQDDKACKQGNTRTFLPVHHQNGGNAWVPDALIQLYPADVNALALTAGKNRAINLLQSAALFEAFDRTDQGPGKIELKVTNLTGHKLPTGYPEGRRIWINIVGYDSTDTPVWESGAYDPATAVLTHDSQVKIYESEPGQESGGVCTPTFHFVLNNCIHSDNRIPPEGFTMAGFSAARAEPVNYVYADGQYWDYTPYTLPSNVVRIEANLYYQTASKEYIDFLSTTPGSGARGTTLADVWNTTGKSPPVLMAAVNLTIDNDQDGMGDAWEAANGLNPNDPLDAAGDIEPDGLTNLEEYQQGTSPTNSDSDGDGLDDGVEVSFGSSPTDPDTDDDTITDLDEYYNPTTDPQVPDVVCNSPSINFGLFCWGDTDGNGSVNLTDIANINNYTSFKLASLPQVYPSNMDTVDLNGDNSVNLSDIAIVNAWSSFKPSSATPPALINVLDPLSPPSVPAGSTQVITVEVKSGGGAAMAGVGVLFTIDGPGTLLGGRGDATGLVDPDGGLFLPGSRWDITGPVGDGGIASITVMVNDDTQPITVNARIPKNGAKELTTSVILSTPVVINP